MRHRRGWHGPLVGLWWALEAVVGSRRSSLYIGSKSIGRLHRTTAIAVRPRAFHCLCDVTIWRRVPIGPWVHRRTSFVIFVFLISLVSPTSHANIATNANATSLFRNDATQRCASSQTRELLGAIDGEWDRLHLEAEMQVCLW